MNGVSEKEKKKKATENVHIFSYRNHLIKFIALTLHVNGSKQREKGFSIMTKVNSAN